MQVIQKIGLCIGFYDLLESSDGLIGHGTGLVNVNGMSGIIFQLKIIALLILCSEIPAHRLPAVQRRNPTRQDL